MPGRPYAPTALADTVRFRHYKPTSIRAPGRARPRSATSEHGRPVHGPVQCCASRWYRSSCAVGGINTAPPNQPSSNGFQGRRSTPALLLAPSAPNSLTSQPRSPTRPASTLPDRPAGLENSLDTALFATLGPQTATGTPTTAARPKPRPEVEKPDRPADHPHPTGNEDDQKSHWPSTATAGRWIQAVAAGSCAKFAAGWNQSSACCRL